MTTASTPSSLSLQCPRGGWGCGGCTMFVVVVMPESVSTAATVCVMMMIMKAGCKLGFSESVGPCWCECLVRGSEEGLSSAAEDVCVFGRQSVPLVCFSGSRHSTSAVPAVISYIKQ